MERCNCPQKSRDQIIIWGICCNIARVEPFSERQQLEQRAACGSVWRD
nr:MAG TPA: hypothetical protein [Caudoviricetes sp.]